jgi:hypothetical protein
MVAVIGTIHVGARKMFADQTQKELETHLSFKPLSLLKYFNPIAPLKI